ncbi:MAG: hypothetical protein AB1489_00690 [Acidobacteriota bacterium]
MDPINVSNIASSSTQQTQSTEAKRVITNDDFETVRTSSSSTELNAEVEKLKESGLVSGDQIRLASTEAQATFERYVQPGSELNGYNTLFHDNRTKLESLRAELDRVGGTRETGQVGNYLNSLDKEFSSLEGILQNIDINAPVNPMEMIKLQVKMESITQNVEVLSKVVDQISTGIKTVLQTNI